MKRLILFFLLVSGFSSACAQGLHTGRIIRSDTRKPVAQARIFMPSGDSAILSNALGFFQVRADSGMVLEITATGLKPGRISVPAASAFTVALEPEEQDTLVYTVIEDMATFPGGFGAFYKYVSKNLRIPGSVWRSGVSGKIFVQFTINADGTIPSEDVKVIKGIHPVADAEVVRVIKLSPKWNPGLQQGKPVRQRMVLPVNIN